MEKCTYTQKVLKEGDEVYYIHGAYVLAGYEGGYCIDTFNKTYIEVFIEASDYNEDEGGYLAGDNVYYTTYGG